MTSLMEVKGFNEISYDELMDVNGGGYGSYTGKLIWHNVKYVAKKTVELAWDITKAANPFLAGSCEYLEDNCGGSF